MFASNHLFSKLKMSFEKRHLIVYNLYGQKVAIKIVTKPNCFGFVDIIDDDIGSYCLKNLYTQAMRLHNVEYVDRFVDKPRRREEWARVHKVDCDVCFEKDKQFEDLRDVPDLYLSDLFTKPESYGTILKGQKLGYLPLPDPKASQLVKLPGDEEVILGLRRQVFALKLSNKMIRTKLETELAECEQKLRASESDRKWYEKECQTATCLIRMYHLVLNYLPPEATRYANRVNKVVRRKSM